MYFRFCGRRHFFHIMGHMDRNNQMTLFGRRRQVAAPEAKSAIPIALLTF